MIDPKPGYKTTEFWLSTAVMLFGAIVASGALADDSIAARVIGGIMAVLSQLGYTAARASSKNTSVKSSAVKELGPGPQ